MPLLTLFTAHLLLVLRWTYDEDHETEGTHRMLDAGMRLLAVAVLLGWWLTYRRAPREDQQIVITRRWFAAGEDERAEDAVL